MLTWVSTANLVFKPTTPIYPIAHAGLHNEANHAVLSLTGIAYWAQRFVIVCASLSATRDQHRKNLAAASISAIGVEPKLKVSLRDVNHVAR
jgi:hypothetical protein